jgi:NhaP-type Na+/H+ or K+/H+ antiporter
VQAELWYVLLGALLAGITLTGALIDRLPLSTAIVYFATGVLIGPEGFGLVRFEVTSAAGWLERAAEAAVLVSLFTAGLKLRIEPTNPWWHLAFRLAFVAMAISIALTTVAGVLALRLPATVAVLLAAILAPTDPVLAAEVQVNSPYDRNRLRFALTGEAGLNDGAAMAGVLLGLSLVTHHGDAGTIGLELLTEIAAFLGGALAGAAIGAGVAVLVLRLRIGRGLALGYNDFLALGLVAMTYGGTQLCHLNGFVAVFAAGYALRRIEMRRAQATDEDVLLLPVSKSGRDEVAADPKRASQYLAESVLVFNEHYERVAELALVILFGIVFRVTALSAATALFAATLLVIVRPVSVLLGLIGSNVSSRERAYMAWFGLRGIGSIYYLAFALTHGAPAEHARTLSNDVMAVIAISIVVHGLSATPLMRVFDRTPTDE